MKLIYGEGCTSTGWKDLPENKTAQELINEVLFVATESEHWSILEEIVKLLGEYGDSSYCEQCGDSYYEVTLDLEYMRSEQ